MTRRELIAALLAIPAAGAGARRWKPRHYTVRVSATTHYYDATQTEVAVWNRALTDSEMRDILSMSDPGSSVWVRTEPE